MQPFTFTPKLALEDVSSVVVPDNLLWKVVQGLLVFALGSGGLAFIWALEPDWKFPPTFLFLAMMGIVSLIAGLSALLLTFTWLGKFWIYERILKATAARGPLTISDEGLEFRRDDRLVQVPWRQVRHYETSGLAIFIETDAGERLILPVNELVERRVLMDLTNRLSSEAPPKEPDSSL